MKSRSRKIGSLNYHIALKFDRHIDSDAAEVPVKFQSNRTMLNTNLMALRDLTIRCHQILKQDPGAHFANDFSTVIQIQWKFHSALITVIKKWLLWNFAQGMIAVLSWHVQNLVGIWFRTTRVMPKWFFVEFELQRKKSIVKWSPGKAYWKHCSFRYGTVFAKLY